MPLSRDLCEKLVDKGYKYLVLKNSILNNEEYNFTDSIIFQALRTKGKNFSVPLTEMCDFPEQSVKKYYIEFED